VIKRRKKGSERGQWKGKEGGGREGGRGDTKEVCKDKCGLCRGGYGERGRRGRKEGEGAHRM